MKELFKYDNDPGLYFIAGNPLANTQPNDNQLKEHTTIALDGKYLTNKYSHTLDYIGTILAGGSSSVGEIKGLVSLKNANLLSQTISTEKVVKADDSDPGKIASSLFNSFKDFGGFPAINNVYTLKTVEPISSYNHSITASTFQLDSRFSSEEQVLEYDQYMNPVTIQKTNGVPTTYLWGYDGKYCIAAIANATLDDVKTALGGNSPAQGIFLQLN